MRTDAQIILDVFFHVTFFLSKRNNGINIKPQQAIASKNKCNCDDYGQVWRRKMWTILINNI